MKNINLIKGATLLSADEAKQVSEDIRTFWNWWWLRSPGYSTPNVSYVDEFGDVGVSIVNRDGGSVRPALQLNLESSDQISDGTKLRIGGYDFTVVCNGKYALCDTSIGRKLVVFREDWQAEDANIYEVSDIKKAVDKWFNDKIMGKPVKYK